MTTKTSLSTLAATAAIFSATLLVGTCAYASEPAGTLQGLHANGSRLVDKAPSRELGHGPAIPQHGNSGVVVSCSPGTGCNTGHKPPVVISCHPVTGCTTTPVKGGGDGDRDHDRDHDRDRPEILIEGAPGEVVVPTPVAPVAALPARVPAAAPVVQAPCNCLTKQALTDGSVLFQDICTKESAIAAPRAVSVR